jgi:hypothetical protein
MARKAFYKLGISYFYISIPNTQDHVTKGSIFFKEGSLAYKF